MNKVFQVDEIRWDDPDYAWRGSIAEDEDPDPYEL